MLVCRPDIQSVRIYKAKNNGSSSSSTTRRFLNSAKVEKRKTPSTPTAATRMRIPIREGFTWVSVPLFRSPNAFSNTGNMENSINMIFSVNSICATCLSRCISRFCMANPPLFRFPILSASGRLPFRVHVGIREASLGQTAPPAPLSVRLIYRTAPRALPADRDTRCRRKKLPAWRPAHKPRPKHRTVSFSLRAPPYYANLSITYPHGGTTAIRQEP